MILILLLFISPIVAFKNDLKIVNGSEAVSGEFPFMVSLRNDSRHFCGGTVLNRKFILTAAHCLCDVNLMDLTVDLAYDLENPREKIRGKSIICNENYSQIEHLNDIAILELQTQISGKYQAVKLVSKNFKCVTDQPGILLGWGLTELGNVSTFLRKTDVIAYDDSSCSKSHFEMYDMEKNMCAGWPENGRGSCQGDSGGPLLIGGFQAGIISFGISSDCGISSRQQPKVLTRISEYVDWIEEKTKSGNEMLRIHLSSFISISILFLLMVI